MAETVAGKEEDELNDPCDETSPREERATSIVIHHDRCTIHFP
jgi:hypothetical protein